jgi:single-strand DNA-binding protein
MSFNKIILVGHLGKDPELKYTPQGTAMCKMSIATSEKRKNSAGENEEHVTWFRVTVWGRQAELCNEYLSRGRQVYVEGRFRLEEYTDREGQKRFSCEVNATDVQFIGARGDSNTDTDRPNAKAAAFEAQKPPSGGVGVGPKPIAENDIPF